MKYVCMLLVAFVSASFAETVPDSLPIRMGGRVQVTVNWLNVRPMPNLSNYPLGAEPYGAEGTVILGPIINGEIWWKIKYDNGRTGYCAGTWLRAVIDLPPPYPSIADRYDSLFFTSEGFEPIILHSIYIREGCGDTSVMMEPFYYVRPQPVGFIYDTTYIQVIYHFTKPPASIEK